MWYFCVSSHGGKFWEGSKYTSYSWRSCCNFEAGEGAGGIKKRFFKPFNEDVYSEVLHKRLQPAIEYATKKDQDAFMKLVNRQFAGKASSQETDLFLLELKKKAIQLGPPRKIRSKEDIPWISNLKKFSEGIQNKQ